MKLNRNNYEEYFILYLDNELSTEDKLEVEIFAEQNPDLKAELDMLMQSKLIPDTGIGFADKNSLLRFDNLSVISTNYPEWLTAYIDDELTEEERKDVERFVTANPAAQKELNLLRQTKLQPEAIVFPYKETLYRKEEKARVIAIRWRRIAAAAVLLLAISTTAIVFVTKSNTTGTEKNGGVAKNNEGQSKDNNSAATGTKENSVPATIETAGIKPGPEKTGTPKREPSQPVIAKQDRKEKEIVGQTKPVELAGNDNTTKPTNNLAKPTNNPNVVEDRIKVDIAQAGSDPIVHPLTESIVKSGNTGVTTSPVDPYNKGTGAVKQDNPEAQFASEKSGGGGLRGFLRKVTRNFEKRTNIKATDDDDRLLIAGLAIKMN